jgi:hypothetical protein
MRTFRLGSSVPILLQKSQIARQIGQYIAEHRRQRPAFGFTHIHDQPCHIGINARRKALSSLAIGFGCHANHVSLAAISDNGDV